MRVYNIQRTKENRQSLRRNHTDAENKLWYHLRNKQFLGMKFFRQYGVGPYIADFYCPRLKLVIEVDGGQHFISSGEIYDAEREKHFTSLRIKTLRFSNLEVLKETAEVLEKIRNELPLVPSLTKEGKC